MKLLIIPIVIALLAGIGGGSGYAYMRASKAFALDSAHRADSLKAHPPEAEGDSTEAELELHDVEPDSAEHEEVDTAATTPADSLRALNAARAALKEGTKGLHDAAPPSAVSHEAEHAAPTPRTPKPVATKPVAPKGEAAPAKTDASHDVKDATTHEAKPKSDAHDTKPTDKAEKAAPTTGAVATALREARNEALATPLPEQRLAKIFGAMPVKEAAKVMEQMSDDDVRMIVGLMNDRQAAAILTALPAARAAAITRGAVKPPEVKP